MRVWCRRGADFEKMRFWFGVGRRGGFFSGFGWVLERPWGRFWEENGVGSEAEKRDDFWEGFFRELGSPGLPRRGPEASILDEFFRVKKRVKNGMNYAERSAAEAGPSKDSH